MEISRRLGLTVGITALGKVNRIPQDTQADHLMGLYRFRPMFGNDGPCPGRAIRGRVAVAKIHDALFGRGRCNGRNTGGEVAE